ncbi:unnamed protein product [Bursaphelenchus okinawaensis]|uniref:Tyrosine-protein phosphatase domain-containing protein n=1 Tax=Bursaphelenchus okinawaensis TaxID=465554 RepID=A0A811KR58_9BILA|nr:unnamed protein product [Bursaphelenchus okinawaensis]CAG9109750.1 unnamed protein product [Bursaphelenchus okinawaensis]
MSGFMNKFGGILGNLTQESNSGGKKKGGGKKKKARTQDVKQEEGAGAQSSKTAKKKKKKSKDNKGGATVTQNIPEDDTGSVMGGSKEQAKRKKKQKSKNNDQTEIQHPPDNNAMTEMRAPTTPTTPTSTSAASNDTVMDKYGFTATLLEKELSGVKKEYNKMKAEEREKPLPPVAGQEPENMNRNRYKNILCFEQPRLRLSDGGYYHANVVDNQFVLAQSPNPNCVVHFWDLIMTNDIEAVVQLHPFDEGRRCSKYYPTQVNQSEEYGPYKVTLAKIEPSPVEEPNLQFFHFKLQGPKGEMTLKHIHWNGFPQFGMPEASNTIPYIWKHIKTRNRILVHCSSGAGRSATLVLTCQLLARVQQNEEINMLNMVKEMRSKRHNAIRNEMQYVYATRIVLFYFMKYNAIEMSQNLLIYIDDFDAYAKKYEKQEKTGDLSEASDELNNV